MAAIIVSSAVHSFYHSSSQTNHHFTSMTLVLDSTSWVMAPSILEDGAPALEKN
jgi:hypothetical protein